MFETRWNNTNPNADRLVSFQSNNPDRFDQQRAKQIVRTNSNESVRSIDNPNSLDELFQALRRRIQRTNQTYDAISFYNSLKICARVFRSYASYNLNTINEFIRRLNKTPRDNHKLLQILGHFQSQLSELRRCHSTFEAELLVTTLAIDFHEDQIENQEQNFSLQTSRGKFSPRSRVSKFRLHQIRQAIDLKTQVRRINEQIQILLFDEFNADLSILWEQTDKFIMSALPFHNHHMTYIVRLIPDVSLKLENALQICSKLFHLEATISERNNFNPTNKKKISGETTSTLLASSYSPRSDFNRSQQGIPEPINFLSIPSGKTDEPLSTIQSANIRTASSVSTASKQNDFNVPSQTERTNGSAGSPLENPLFPSLFNSTEKLSGTSNDQSKLELLTEQLDKRLIDEEKYQARLKICLEKVSLKSNELEKLSQTDVSSTMQPETTASVEYKKTLCSNDILIHQSVSEELNVALHETQNRIRWLENVLERARLCLK